MSFIKICEKSTNSSWLWSLERRPLQTILTTFVAKVNSTKQKVKSWNKLLEHLD